MKDITIETILQVVFGLSEGERCLDAHYLAPVLNDTTAHNGDMVKHSVGLVPRLKVTAEPFRESHHYQQIKPLLIVLLNLTGSPFKV